MTDDFTAMPDAFEQVFSTPELLELILSYCHPKRLYALQAVSQSWKYTIARSPYLERLLFRRAIAGALVDNPEWCRAWETLYPDRGDDTITKGGYEWVTYYVHPVLFANLDNSENHSNFGGDSDSEEGDRVLQLVYSREPPPRPRRVDMTFLELHEGPRALLVGIRPPFFANLQTKWSPPEAAGTDAGAGVAAAQPTPSWEDHLISQPPAKRVLMRMWWERGPTGPKPDPAESPFYGLEKYQIATVGNPHGVTLGMVSRAVRSFVWRNRRPGLTFIAVELLLRFQ